MIERASLMALGAALGAMLFASPAASHPAHRSETRIPSSGQANEHASPQSGVTRSTARSTEDLLRDTPGLFLQRHSSEAKGLQLFARGFDAQHGTDVEMRVNGIPVNQGSHVHGHGYIDLVWLPTLLVDGVNYVAGSYRVDQGPFSTAASVDLSTFTGAALADANPHESIQLHLQGTHRGRFKAGAMTYHVGENNSAVFAGEVAHDVGAGARRQSTRISTMAQLQWEPRRTSRHSLTIAAGTSFFEIPTLLRTSDLTNERISSNGSYLSDLEGESTGLRLAWNWFARPRTGTTSTTDLWLDARTFGYLDNNTGYLLYTAGDTQNQQDTRISVGVQNLTRLHFSSRRQLIFSSSLRFEHVDNSAIRIAGNAQNVVSSLQRPVDNLWTGAHAMRVGTTNTHEEARNDRALQANLLSGSFGLSWVAFAGEKFRSELSLRADAFFVEAKDELQDLAGAQAALRVLPRWRGRYRIDEHLTLSTGVGMGVRPAEARSVLSAEGEATKGLQPTTSTSGDLGLSLHYDAVHLQVSGFGVWVTNEALFDHVSGLMWIQNATRRVGVEASAEFQIQPWLQVSGAWTAVDARYIDSSKRVPAAPRSFGFMQARFTPHPDVSFEVKGRFAGPRDLRYEGRAGGWAKLDVQGSWRASERIELGVSVENVTNSRHAEALYNYASHWNPEEPVSVLPRLHALYSAPWTTWFDLKLWL